MHPTIGRLRVGDRLPGGRRRASDEARRARRRDAVLRLRPPPHRRAHPAFAPASAAGRWRSTTRSRPIRCRPWSSISRVRSMASMWHRRREMQTALDTHDAGATHRLCRAGQDRGGTGAGDRRRHHVSKSSPWRIARHRRVSPSKSGCARASRSASIPISRSRARACGWAAGPQQFGIDAEHVPEVLRELAALRPRFHGFHIFAGSQNLRADI